MLDPETGYDVAVTGDNKQIVGRMGDERVTAFVQYHMDMMQMRQGVDKRDVKDLYARFYRYLMYCAEHGIVPNNMNAYFAIGIARQDVSAWHNGKGGTPEHKEFADMMMQFFASVHEQGATDGVLNPISAMFWQKAHDNLIEASKDATAHAELLAIREAQKKQGRRLTDCTLYVTVEPCPMCAGALAWSQIGKVVYGASDPKRGFSMFSPSLMHPKTQVVSGVLADECSSLVTEFFRNKRS